jgi:hypothetical protein
VLVTPALGAPCSLASRSKVDLRSTDGSTGCVDHANAGRRWACDIRGYPMSPEALETESIWVRLLAPLG